MTAPCRAAANRPSSGPVKGWQGRPGCLALVVLAVVLSARAGATGPRAGAPAAVLGAAASAGLPRSQNVALVPSAGGRFNFGGTLPTSGFPDGYAPVFTNVPVESIRDNPTNPLIGFDTVVLNGICDIGTFLANPQFKARIEDFVAGGGKLIIWDSECERTDYSNFAVPFTTNNPGAQGAFGSLTDAEENQLSSTDPDSPSFVNLAAVSGGTDAVGDANVFTTFDPRWFVDLQARNANGATGPVQAYANLGDGLIIYSGLDKDDMGSGGFDPRSTSGRVHLNRIWLLELLQPWNPDNLPHSTSVVGSQGVGEGSPVPVAAPPEALGLLASGGMPRVTWSYVPGPDVDPGTTCTFADPNGVQQNAITCTDDGTFDVTFSLDVGGQTFTSTSTVHMVNVAPTVTILGPANGTSIGVDTPLTLTAAFTDPGTNDTHVCTVDWGDRTVTRGTVREANGRGTCDVVHSYTAPGQYIIAVTVLDDDQLGPGSVALQAASPSTGVTAVEGPAGGRVTTTTVAQAGTILTTTTKPSALAPAPASASAPEQATTTTIPPPATTVPMPAPTSATVPPSATTTTTLEPQVAPSASRAPSAVGGVGAWSGGWSAHPPR